MSEIDDLEFIPLRVSKEKKTDFLLVLLREYEFPICEIVIGVDVFR